MCLQWCHVTHQLIDNDYPCEHCPVERRGAYQGQACDGCRHFTRRAGREALCALTHGPAPLAACCHYDCPLDSGLLVIEPDDVAAGLLDRYGVGAVAGLFERSETAPECQPVGASVRVALADLAVPEVYGLPAEAWDAALGRPALPILDWEALPWPVIGDETP